MKKYLIYLRKSRKDKELEDASGEDTLYRHRHTLLQYAKEHSMHIAKIYEEVVSGESIAARPEVQKLLRDVETGEYAGVLVMEVERLARGNTKDQGIIAETFSYSGAKIITPNKIYDPSNDEDEEYFEFGLFMSRREYKTISRRIQRGRMASLEEGKYIASTAPYGYERYKLSKQKGWSLRIVPEQAETVQLIFNLYTEGDVIEGSVTRLGCMRIAERLNNLGIPTRNGVGRWDRGSVREILHNATYAGYVRWGVRQYKKKIENGSVDYVHHQNFNAPLIQGLHEPIIPVQQWEKAQRLLTSRAAAPVKSSTDITNPLASLAFCHLCGKAMVRNIQRGVPRFSCTNPDCPTISSKFELVENGVIHILKSWIQDYTVEIGQQKNVDPPSNTLQQITKAEANLKKLLLQKNKLYDFLEQGIYTTEVFLERSEKLANQIETQESELNKLKEKNRREIDFLHKKESFFPTVQKVVDTYFTLHNVKDKNELLKEVVDKIVYHKTKGSRYTESDMVLYVYPKIH